MRTFTIRKGKYAGEHLLYDSIEEARQAGKIPKSPWYSNEVEVGDWCVSDDGYVLQCLKRDRLINKRHKSGQYTDYFRFCNGTFYVYYAKGGKRRIKNFYGVASANHKSSLGNTSSLGKYMTLKKKHFVVLVGGGIDPYHAYVEAYKVNGATRHNIWMQVNKLLSDPVVRRELMEQLKPVIVKLEQQISKETGAESLQDWLVDELTTLLAKNKKLSPKDRRENIKLIIALFGEPLGVIAPKKNKLDAQEVDWTEIPPPKLGTNQTEYNYGNTANSGNSDTSNSDNNTRDISSISVDEKQTQTESAQNASGAPDELLQMYDRQKQDSPHVETASKTEVE